MEDEPEEHAYFDVDPARWLKVTNHAAFSALMRENLFLSSAYKFGRSVILCTAPESIRVAVAVHYPHGGIAIDEVWFHADVPRQPLPRGIGPDMKRTPRDLTDKSALDELLWPQLPTFVRDEFGWEAGDETPL